MKQLWKRHYTSFNQLRKSTSISDNIDLLKLSPANRTPILYASLLQTCTRERVFRQGLQFQAHVTKTGLEGDRFVGNSLLALYFKLCPSFCESQKVFNGMLYRDVVSWSSMISGYIRAGKPKLSIHLYVEMVGTGLNPNAYTLSTVVKACSELQELRLGKCFHGVVIKCNFETNYVNLRKSGWRDIVVESALVDLYAKCGCIDFAHRIFVQMSVRNVITWNSMISGFAQNGRGEEAVEFFDKMIKVGARPDNISFVNVLFACSHSGLLDQGRRYFVSMTDDYGIKAEVSHYSCMVDLLGRASQIEEAENLVSRSEFCDDSSLWISLLGACTTGTNPTVAERVAKKVMKLKPEYHLSYVLLGNVYREVGRWNDALEIMRQMKDKNILKIAGSSWVES